jgi:hypothetical protein
VPGTPQPSSSSTTPCILQGIDGLCLSTRR